MALCRSIRRRVIGSVGGRNVAVGPDGYPLRVHGRHIGLEVTELLLLLGMPSYFTASLFSLSLCMRNLGDWPQIGEVRCYSCGEKRSAHKALCVFEAKSQPLLGLRRASNVSIEDSSYFEP